MSSLIGGSPLRQTVVPLPDLGPTDLVATMPASEAALVSMRPSIARFLALEPAVRLGVDPEAIHHMRVAARRIRTALRIFRGAVPGWSESLRDEIRWVASKLGEVRDLDVQRMSLASALEDLAPEERGVVHSLDDHLAGRRADAHARLLEELDSIRFERIRREVVALGRGPGVVTEEGARPITQVAPVLVRKPYRAMRRAGKHLGPDAPSASLHALRIKCKRARYAIEFVSPLYGEQADAMIARLVRLQDLLGDLHDAETVARSWRELAAEKGDALPFEAGFVLGRLAERSALHARELRRGFPRAFRRVRGRRWKELNRAMQARPAT